MKNSRFTEEQIAYALKQVELGMAVGEVCRKMGIAEATLYVWRKKYGGLGPSELKRLRLLEEENPGGEPVSSGSSEAPTPASTILSWRSVITSIVITTTPGSSSGTRAPTPSSLPLLAQPTRLLNIICETSHMQSSRLAFQRSHLERAFGSSRSLRIASSLTPDAARLAARRIATSFWAVVM